MIVISKDEAILFRLLVGFFGEDRVIPHMSVRAVCGDSLEACKQTPIEAGILETYRTSIREWASHHKCLFTIVNHEDNARMVIEYIPTQARVIDLHDLNRRKFLRPILGKAGICYVTVNTDELRDITDPASRGGLVEFLESKFDSSTPAAVSEEG